MSYQIKCDEFPILDMRDEDLIVTSPKVTLEANTIGSASFTIYQEHPYYDDMKKLKSIFEVSDETGVIFRGIMPEDALDFENRKKVNLDGLMTFFNGSIVRPFNFPEDFIEDADYIAAAESGNVVEFFLKWLIDNHNNQCQSWQHFKLGDVTVVDPNNYINRSSKDYTTTWDAIKSKLFNSTLGGYLCVRYEDDGNYIDYLSEFTLTNTQEILFGENLLDLSSETDANKTYSAIIPVGATLETTSENEDGTSTALKQKLTLEKFPDGNITEDIVKKGDTLYSIGAVEKYGWRCAPVKESTWDDVTDVNNLLTKAVDFLTNTALMMSNTIKVTAVDLHFSDKEIRSFRICRNAVCHSKPHGITMTKPLTKLSIDLLKPQNTKITLGDTRLTLTDVNNQQQSNTQNRIESAEKDIEDNRTNVTEVKNQMVIQRTEIVNTCNEIFMSALKEYVVTSNFEEFRSTLKSELEVLAEGITGRVSQTEEDIRNVNGDLQAKFTEITKYFTFDINGLTIGQVDNPNKVVIDNDEIKIMVNNIPVQEFKADVNSSEFSSDSYSLKARSRKASISSIVYPYFLLSFDILSSLASISLSVAVGSSSISDMTA